MIIFFGVVPASHFWTVSLERAETVFSHRKAYGKMPSREAGHFACKPVLLKFSKTIDYAGGYLLFSYCNLRFIFWNNIIPILWII
jgi:hypothetical protein